MICFKEDNKIVMANIVSNNDQVLQSYLNSIEVRKLGSYELSKEEILSKSNSDERIIFNNDATKYKTNYFNDNYRLIEAEFRLKKLTLFKILKEALEGKNHNNIYQMIKLEDFFNNLTQDLTILNSIENNAYFNVMLDKMYNEFKSFLEIYPYISFEKVASCNLNDLKNMLTTEKELSNLTGYQSSNVQSILASETIAKNNTMVLTKTRRIIGC